MGSVRRMHKNTLKNNQQGLVSFVVTIIIMLILSLIVIGFARLSRREQRQALDRQLSTQAFYAAEAGVNDAVEYLRTTPAAATTEKTDCSNLPGYNNVLNTTGPISYTCVLIDPTPTEYRFDAIDSSDSEIVMMQAEGGTAIQEINFYWEDQAGGTGLGACPNLSSTETLPQDWPSTCNTGILRIDLIPYNAAATPTRDGLVNSQMTAFLYPNSSGPGAHTYIGGLSSQGSLVAGDCAASNPVKVCRVTVSGLGGNRYYLRMKTIFGTSAVTVTAEDASGNLIELGGYQALIDATGKANDVLRRIQVSVPINGITGPFSEYSAQTTGSLCKRFGFIPGSGSPILPVAPATDVNECGARQP
jgi:Tfp pilus assembly protein PilX